MKKVLVTYPIHREGLTGLFERYDVTYCEEPMKKAHLASVIGEYDGVLAAGVRMTEAEMAAAGKLKVISVYGAGYDNVDTEAAARYGIVVANIPDTVTESTAETAFGLMLSLMRRITECDRKIRNKTLKWGMMNNLGVNLYGKELGIVGMGRIGRAVAKRAAAFGMRISYYNRNRLDPAVEEECKAVYKGLDDLLQNADVVSLNAPLTPETWHLIGERELNLMKPSAFLVNTARGAVIDEKALISHLQQGRIKGAALDVFENEPRVPEELLELDNVVLSPHLGTEATEVRIQMARDASQNIIDCLEGRKPLYVVNPSVYNSR